MNYLHLITSVVVRTIIVTLVLLGLTCGISWYLDKLNPEGFSVSLIWVGGATVFIGSFLTVGGGSPHYGGRPTTSPSVSEWNEEGRLIRSSLRFGVPVAVSGMLMIGLALLQF